MDPFDTFFVGRTLNERWKVTARRHVIPEAPSACRTYDASGVHLGSTWALNATCPPRPTSFTARAAHEHARAQHFPLHNVAVGQPGILEPVSVRRESGAVRHAQ